ncbi:MAG: pyridoxal 5'-phosphate synthase glutaminase subunit PdxT [Chloroflexi bacterium]|nr:pyridoxal 5'-phosphate synthase glutaminase subunit PdxT [Chloroflexota bacterium]
MRHAVGSRKRIGVLALQGAFIEHVKMLQGLGVEAVQVRLPQHLDGLDGLIIPGGESTTIGKLMVDFELIEPLRRFGEQKAIWGTCAGAILLSRDIHRTQPLLGLMDITVERNAFGRQVDSFSADLSVPCLSLVSQDPSPFHAVFIRAPIIEKVLNGTEVLARLQDGKIIAARQGHFLATSFHPELTGDDRFHRYFLERVL